jgi:CopG family nickel-responsive transcriptional regulator
MIGLIRYGISIEKELNDSFEKIIGKRGYKNRSEAIRDMMRSLVQEEKISADNSFVFGIISFIYDHHKRGIEKELNNIQHHEFESIVYTNHVHINHDNCLEIIVVKNKSSKIKKLAGKLLSLKGVKNGKISLMSL